MSPRHSRGLGGYSGSLCRLSFTVVEVRQVEFKLDGVGLATEKLFPLMVRPIMQDADHTALTTMARSNRKTNLHNTFSTYYTFLYLYNARGIEFVSICPEWIRAVC